MLTATLVNNSQAKIQAWINAARAGLKTGVEAGAALFEGQAKDNAPVLTGRLRDGIHTDVLVDTDTQQQRGVTPVVPAGNKYGFEPPYARRIEFGFIGVDSLGRHYHQLPHAYMRPAFDTEQEAAAEAVKDGVTQALEGVA